MDTQDIAGQDKVPEAHDPKEFVTGIKVEKSISINRPVNEVYSFWRDFENLPKIMSHIKKVDVMDSRHSHWTMHAPARTTVEWDAEIIDEREKELISWRSLEGSEVANAGNVHFTESPNGNGTEVHLSMQYDPPGGWVGKFAAWLFGEVPEEAIEKDLQQFKALMESANYKDTKELPVTA